MTAQTSHLCGFTNVIKFIAYTLKLLCKNCLYSMPIIHNLHYVAMQEFDFTFFLHYTYGFTYLLIRTHPSFFSHKILLEPAQLQNQCTLLSIHVYCTFSPQQAFIQEMTQERVKSDFIRVRRGNSVKIRVHKHTASREVQGYGPRIFFNFRLFHIASGAFSGVLSAQVLYLLKCTICNNNNHCIDQNSSASPSS